LKNPLKILGITFGAILALILVLAIALPFLVDPNEYKKDIAAAVKQQTGRDLNIKGDIDLSIFPWIGLDIGNTLLGNAPGFGRQPFASIQSIELKVALIPLLSKKVVVKKLTLEGLRLNLTRNTAGVTNWDDLLAPSATDSAPTEHKPVKEESPETDIEQLSAFSIDSIQIRNAELNWNDLGEKLHYGIKKFNFETGKLAIDEPINISLSMEMEGLIPERIIPLALESVITVDINNQRIAIDRLALKLDNSQLNGNASLTNFSKPRYRFDLRVDQFDVDRFIGTTASTESGQEIESAGAQSSPPPSLAGLRPLDMKGKFRLDRLQVAGLKMSDIQMVLDAKNGVLAISDFSAALYQGKAKGRLTVDVRPDNPEIRVVQSLKNIEIGPILRDMDLWDKFEGKGNVTLDISTAGLTEQLIARNLNGSMAFLFKNGNVKGVDFLEMARKGRDRIKQFRDKTVSAKAKNSDKTVYETIKGTFNIRNGLAKNDDLIMQSRETDISGKGSADLGKDRIDYRVQVHEKKRGKRTGNKVPPVLIYGKLSAPKFKLDLSQMAKQAVKKKKKEVKRKAKERLKKKAKERLKGLFDR